MRSGWTSGLRLPRETGKDSSKRRQGWTASRKSRVINQLSELGTRSEHRLGKLQQHVQRHLGQYRLEQLDLERRPAGKLKETGQGSGTVSTAEGPSWGVGEEEATEERDGNEDRKYS